METVWWALCCPVWVINLGHFTFRLMLSSGGNVSSCQYTDKCGQQHDSWDFPQTLVRCWGSSPARLWWVTSWALCHTSCITRPEKKHAYSRITIIIYCMKGFTFISRSCLIEIVMWASLILRMANLQTHLKIKFFLLAFMVPRGTIYTHGFFTLQQRFFIVKKGSLDYQNVIHTQKNKCLLSIDHWKFFFVKQKWQWNPIWNVFKKTKLF